LIHHQRRSRPGRDRRWTAAAYYSEEAIHTVRDSAASEVVRVLTGQAPLSPVNTV